MVYMPGRDLSAIAREWRAAGLPGDYPCVLISRAGQPEQQVTRTTLSLLHVTAPGPAPVLLMGGAVFAERHASAQVSEQKAAVLHQTGHPPKHLQDWTL